MKTLATILTSLLSAFCIANAQTAVSLRKLSVAGGSLPEIRHITDMKTSGDTLYFVYETADGFGQRFLRRAIIDKDRATLDVGEEIGRRADGSYVSYMPYPFFTPDGKVRIVSQDDCGIFELSGNALMRTKEYIISGGSSVPFSISQYVQDVFMASSDNYVFVGRQPNGGSQYAMTADISDKRIDTIRATAVSPELKAWMPNAGELAYSGRHSRLAFAYRLHPVIEFFGMDGKLISRLRIADDTFNPATLGEADFEELNPWHIVDLSSTGDRLYALVWGHSYKDMTSQGCASTIYEIDWNGKIMSQYKVNIPLFRIAHYGAGSLIGWTGREFVSIAI